MELLEIVVFKGAGVPEFEYEDLLPLGADNTAYRLLTKEGVRTVEGPDGRSFLEVAPEALRLLTETAMHDIAHYLRPAHLTQVRSIIDDPEASNNDKFVALDLLKNANIAAGGVLPMWHAVDQRRPDPFEAIGQADPAQVANRGAVNTGLAQPEAQRAEHQQQRQAGRKAQQQHAQRGGFGVDAPDIAPGDFFGAV